jgi:hypothetical protein
MSRRRWRYYATRSKRDGWYIRAESKRPSLLDIPFLLPRENTAGERKAWPMATEHVARAIADLLNERAS